MYSRRNASGGEQSDVHFCTCRARCRTSKLPAAQTTGCLKCVKGNPAVDDKLADEVMNLLMSLRAPRQALGGVARVWGVPPTSSSNPPTPPHSLPIPHPETPQLNKVPQVTPILIVGLQLWRKKQRKKKFGWPDTWSRISSFNMNEMAEWGFFLQTFGTFLGFSIPFLNPFHPCTIGTTTLDLKFISGRHHQHAKGLKEEDFRFSFWILKEK